MNECMYDNWNETVKPNDIIFHLGDLVWDTDTVFVNTFKKLNGKKKLIVGNHDNIKWIVSQNLFHEVMMWHLLRENGFLCSHVPLDKSSLKTYVKDEDGVEDYTRTNQFYINIHGHIHQNLSPSINHRCVCVEWTNYTPIHLDNLRKLQNFIV